MQKNVGFTPILILVIILIVAGVAFVLGQSLKTTPSTVTSSPTTESTTNEESRFTDTTVNLLTPIASSPTGTDRVQLKSYSSQSLRFDIMYPDFENKITPQEVEKGLRVGFCAGGTDACTLWVERFLSNTINDVYNKDLNSVALESSTQLTAYSIGEKTYQKVDLLYVDSKEEKYYIQYGNNVYTVVFPKQYNFAQELKDQILSTFKFTQ